MYRFPAYGQTVRTPADAVVASVREGDPDTEIYHPLDPTVTEDDPHALAGNHVVLDFENGEYLLMAHFKSGSLLVKPGERVRRGQALGLCGNSGNSGEPHIHIQLMDGPEFLTAIGLPFGFDGVELPQGAGVASSLPPAGTLLQGAWPTVIRNEEGLQLPVAPKPSPTR